MKIAQLKNTQSLPSKARRIRGQGMTEYIIIVALIAVAAIAVVGAFGGVVQEQFAVMAQSLAGDTAGAGTSRTDADNAAAAAGTAATTSTLKDFEK